MKNKFAHTKQTQNLSNHIDNSENETKGRPDTHQAYCKDNERHAPAQFRLAQTHGTHDTHDTQTKTKRSRPPGYRGGQAVLTVWLLQKIHRDHEEHVGGLPGAPLSSNTYTHEYLGVGLFAKKTKII